MKTHRGSAFVLGVGVGAAGLAIIWRLHWLESHQVAIDWPATISSGASIAQVTAFLVAGFWTYTLFVRQRLDQQRAEVVLHVQPVVVDDTERLLRVALEIRKVGSVELCPKSAAIHVQQVVRPGAKISLPQSTSGTPLTGYELIQTWPELQRCNIDLKAEKLTLEPGETERYPLDFVLPADAGVIQVRAVVSDPDADGLYWDEATLCDLRADVSGT